MKVIILAGGWGTRLGRQSVEIPKPMVLIGDKPILWHIMKIFSAHGLNEFIISCGVKAHVIKNYFANYDNYNADYKIDLKTSEITYFNKSAKEEWEVSLIDTGINTLKGARIKRLERFLDHDVNLVTYGDCVSDVNITALIEFHKSHGKILTITGVHPSARFGELIEDNGRAVSFKEKPQTSVGIINGGFMVFNKELLDYLSDDETCDFESGAVELLAKKSEVMVFKHEGNWECMDHERDVQYLNELWKNGKAFWK
tara:strand:- start:1664 stop:2431 length:768 start_codon:yes stop_codon:yes gene_type:complete